MIVKMTGKLVMVDDEGVVLDRDGICYQVLVPAFVHGALAGKIGQTITLHTIEYYEGAAMGGNIYPRLVGFTDADDRSFFLDFIKVRGLGYRKALRAFAQPVQAIASAIEAADVKFLASLPEIGKRTAAQLVATLRGKLDRFAFASNTVVSTTDDENLDQVQREALEVLMQLGERRNDAVDMIQKVCRNDPKLNDPGNIVEAVYRRKSAMV